MSWSKIIADFSAQPVVESTQKKSASHKHCLGCQQLLPVTDFYRRDKHGYTSRCKPCFIKRKKERGWK